MFSKFIPFRHFLLKCWFYLRCHELVTNSLKNMKKLQHEMFNWKNGESQKKNQHSHLLFLQNKSIFAKLHFVNLPECFHDTKAFVSTSIFILGRFFLLIFIYFEGVALSGNGMEGNSLKSGHLFYKSLRYLLFFLWFCNLIIFKWKL